MDYSTIKEKYIDPKNSAVFEHLPKQGGTLSIINCDVNLVCPLPRLCTLDLIL